MFNPEDVNEKQKAIAQGFEDMLEVKKIDPKLDEVRIFRCIHEQNAGVFMTKCDECNWKDEDYYEEEECPNSFDLYWWERLKEDRESKIRLLNAIQHLVTRKVESEIELMRIELRNLY